MNKTELRELSQRLRRQLTQKFIFFYLLYLAAGAAIFILAYLYIKAVSGMDMRRFISWSIWRNGSGRSFSPSMPAAERWRWAVII